MRALVAALLAAVLFALCASPVSAGRVPTGTFTLEGSFVEGTTLTVTVETTGALRKHEVTLGVWCFQPDGAPLPIGNRNADYIYELTSGRGPWPGPQYLALWVTGTGYRCTARLVAVEWFKGTPVRAWVLDEQVFSVEA